MRTLLLLLALCVGCSGPSARTQVMVEIDADEMVRNTASVLEVRITGGEYGANVDTYAVRLMRAFDPPGWPRTLALIPLDAEQDRGYEITVHARLADQTIAVTRQVIAGYVRERTILMQLSLEANCVNLACDNGLTCIEGTCRDSRIDVAALPDYPEDDSNP